MKLSYVTYVLGLIVLLMLVSDCDCSDRSPDPHFSFVTCDQVGGPGNSKNVPVLFEMGFDVDGITEHYTSVGQFDPSQWSCADTQNSPVWQGSGEPVYSAHNPYSPQAVRRKAVALASSSSAAYLPVRLLNLPFPAQPSASDPAPSCDSSQPDVLQVNHDNATVNRMATCPFKPVATIPVVTRPLQIAITPDGQTALVTSFDNAVNFINLNTNQVTYTMPTPGINPNGIAISPDGNTAYITSFVPTGALIAKIDIASRKITNTIQADALYPQNVILSPDGSQLFVTYPYASLVSIIDTLTFSEAYKFAISAPRGIAFNSAGTKAYIASTDNPDASVSPGTVQELNTDTFHIDNVYHVGVGPNDVAVLYGDQFVVTTNYEGQSISTIDTSTGVVTNTAIGGSPSGISILQ